MKIGSCLILLSLLLGSMVFIFQFMPLNYVVVFLLLAFNMYCITKIPTLGAKDMCLLTIAICVFCIWTFYCWSIAPKYQMGLHGLVSTSQIRTTIIKGTSIYSQNQAEAVPLDPFFRNSHPQRRATARDSVRLSAHWQVIFDGLTRLDTVIPVQRPALA